MDVIRFKRRKHARELSAAIDRSQLRSMEIGARVIALAVLAALGLLAPAAHAAQSLDSGFGRNGVSLPGPQNRMISDLAEVGNGSVVGSGLYGGQFIARYTPGGALDTLFGESGVVPTRAFQYGSNLPAVAAAPNGDLIGAGIANESAMLVMRFHSDGTPDVSFGDEGSARTGLGEGEGGARDVAVLPGGHILAAGYFRNRASRRWRAVATAYRSDGRPDDSFGEKNGLLDLKATGRTVIGFEAIGVLPDRKVLLLGEVGGRLFLLRLNRAGLPDRSFGKDGLIYYDVDGSPLCLCSEATGMAIDGRGRLVISASTGEGEAVVMRLRTNGHRDRSFGRQGVVRKRIGTRLGAEDVVVQKNGKIAIPGYFNVADGEARVAVFRLLSNGRPDLTFAHRGVYTHDFGNEGVAIAALALRDGDLLVGGRANRTDPGQHELAETAEPFLIRFRP